MKRRGIELRRWIFGVGALALTTLTPAHRAPGAELDPAAGPTGAESMASGSGFAFRDVAAESGLTVSTWAGRPEKPHILESGGAGVALLDADGDGLLDVYVVNGWRLDGAEVVERGRNRLYRNLGGLRFDDVTDAAGVGDDGWGAAATVGDVDGDGRPDLFVSNFGPDVLYRNRGDGSFALVADGPGMAGWSSSAAFFDADGDGDLDLYVTAYIDADLDEVLRARPRLVWKGLHVMVGPFGLDGAVNRFFRNEGTGRFVEATDEAGLTDVGRFYSFGVVATDLDDDGLPDLYVANDSNPNYLFHDLGGGRFEEVGLWSGAGFDASGAAQAGMGIAAADYDGDGRTDLFVTHFAQDHATLYHNRGELVFEDVSVETGIRAATFEPLSWGTCFGDFDLDGDLDLFVANGHIYPQADEPGTDTSFAQTNQLLENVDGAFVDVSASAGPGFAVRESSRGAACGDLDSDGDLDVVVWNVDAPPTLLRNETARRGAWLIVDAPGASRVEVRAGDRAWSRALVQGGSYASASDPRFHFGLGPVSAVDEVRVEWADGTTTVREAVAAGRVLRIDG